MLIYLDACSLQRPLDDRTHPRNNIEAEAVLTILRLVESGHIELLTSEVLQFEIDRTPNQYRKGQVIEMLKLATRVIEINDEIESEAKIFIQAGVKPLDALHLASASWAKADYFCTCDDKLLKRPINFRSDATVMISPLQQVTEVAR
jgi:predicted nucleic acid-binding protein